MASLKTELEAELKRLKRKLHKKQRIIQNYDKAVRAKRHVQATLKRENSEKEENEHENFEEASRVVTFREGSPDIIFVTQNSSKEFKDTEKLPSPSTRGKEDFEEHPATNPAVYSKDDSVDLYENAIDQQINTCISEVLVPDGDAYDVKLSSACDSNNSAYFDTSQSLLQISVANMANFINSNPKKNPDDFANVNSCSIYKDQNICNPASICEDFSVKSLDNACNDLPENLELKNNIDSKSKDIDCAVDSEYFMEFNLNNYCLGNILYCTVYESTECLNVYLVQEKGISVWENFFSTSWSLRRKVEHDIAESHLVKKISTAMFSDINENKLLIACQKLDILSFIIFFDTETAIIAESKKNIVNNFILICPTWFWHFAFYFETSEMETEYYHLCEVSLDVAYSRRFSCWQLNAENLKSRYNVINAVHFMVPLSKKGTLYSRIVLWIEKEYSITYDFNNEVVLLKIDFLNSQAFSHPLHFFEYSGYLCICGIENDIFSLVIFNPVDVDRKVVKFLNKYNYRLHAVPVFYGSSKKFVLYSDGKGYFLE